MSGEVAGRDVDHDDDAEFTTSLRSELFSRASRFFRLARETKISLSTIYQRRLDTYSLTCAVTCPLLHLITFDVAFQQAISLLRS